MSINTNTNSKDNNQISRSIQQTSLNGLMTSIACEFNNLIDDISNKVEILNNLKEEESKAEMKLEASAMVIAKLLKEKENLVNEINSLDADFNLLTDQLKENSNV